MYSTCVIVTKLRKHFSVSTRAKPGRVACILINGRELVEIRLLKLLEVLLQSLMWCLRQNEILAPLPFW
jgi:hypothetical protein